MEKLPFDPKSTEGNRKTPIDFRGAWISPIMCLYSIYQNPRICQESVKAARDEKDNDDPGKHNNKYL